MRHSKHSTKPHEACPVAALAKSLWDRLGYLQLRQQGWIFLSHITNKQE